MDEDFSNWDTGSVAERARLVCDFDRLADEIVAEAVYLAENCTAEEETVYVPQKRMILKYA
ncbi:MAG: hypothetical protein LUE14_04570 [Clostridiales bacterium]|nr:hypothetical protein [Clostridiales bacterium]